MAFHGLEPLLRGEQPLDQTEVGHTVGGHLYCGEVGWLDPVTVVSKDQATVSGEVWGPFTPIIIFGPTLFPLCLILENIGFVRKFR